ncbi:hypothetical protein DWW67_06040 [Coprobacillus sp. AF16-47]|jgi:hypothetical protein|nr:hypothetical protein DWW67_06040 [Coprobacillus sp. AF16-47]DAJ79495.1 MAG TPA: hypothetical protein [Caudoviricetes sp.]
MPFSKKAFKGLVSHARREISTAKYKIGTTNYLATINSIEEKDSELVIYLQFNPDVKNEVTISEVSLYDTSEELFYNQAENIKFNPLNEGVICKVTINFKEVS